MIPVGMFILRTYAIWGRSRRILIILLGSFFVRLDLSRASLLRWQLFHRQFWSQSSISWLALATQWQVCVPVAAKEWHQSMHLQVSEPPIPNITSCYNVGESRIIVVAYVLLVVAEFGEWALNEKKSIRFDQVSHRNFVFYTIPLYQTLQKSYKRQSLAQYSHSAQHILFHLRTLYVVKQSRQFVLAAETIWPVFSLFVILTIALLPVRAHLSQLAFMLPVLTSRHDSLCTVIWLQSTSCVGVGEWDTQ